MNYANYAVVHARHLADKICLILCRHLLPNVRYTHLSIAVVLYL